MNFLIARAIARNEAIALTQATNWSLEAIAQTQSTNLSLEAITIKRAFQFSYEIEYLRWHYGFKLYLI